MFEFLIFDCRVFTASQKLSDLGFYWLREDISATRLAGARHERNGGVGKDSQG